MSISAGDKAFIVNIIMDTLQNCMTDHSVTSSCCFSSAGRRASVRSGRGVDNSLPAAGTPHPELIIIGDQTRTTEFRGAAPRLDVTTEEYVHYLESSCDSLLQCPV